MILEFSAKPWLMIKRKNLRATSSPKHTRKIDKIFAVKPHTNFFSVNSTTLAKNYPPVKTIPEVTLLS